MNPATTLTARTPEDLIALAPVVLGFQPEESLVMLTFGDGAFHARIDLPGSPDDVAGVVEAVVAPLVAHGLRRAVFLVFSTSPSQVGLVPTLLNACADHAVDVVDVLRADGRRWFRLHDRGTGPGVAYDVSHHPFHARSVVEGQVTWSSRRALAASLKPQADRVAAVRVLVEGLPGVVPRSQIAAERAWLVALLSAADEGDLPSDEACARLLRDLADGRLWEEALCWLTRQRADTQRALWTSVLRRAPDDRVAAAAVLLGFAGWLGGQGALAWCAVDRCLAEAPEDSRARMLADLLLRAVPPSRWAAGAVGL